MREHEVVVKHADEVMTKYENRNVGEYGNCYGSRCDRLNWQMYGGRPGPVKMPAGMRQKELTDRRVVLHGGYN